MAEQLNYNINVTGNASESVGSLKKQLREAQNEVGALSDKFGATSQQAIEAAKRAAELKDRIGDAKALTDAFNPDAKFKALSSSLSGVAGGFAAVQGAIGLFGAESKELEKQLLKVQSALALSQGLQSVGESIDSFKQLGAVIKTQVVTAFSTLRGAIVATGIGALVVALGLVVANFDKVKKVVLNLLPGLADVADFIGNLVNNVTDFIGVTSEAGRATAKLIKDNDKALKDSERNLELNGDKYDEYTRRKIEANNEFKRKQNEFLKDEQLSEDETNKFVIQAREKANREIVTAEKDRNDALLKANEEAAEKRKIQDEKRIKDAQDLQDKLDEIAKRVQKAGLDFEKIQFENNEKKKKDAEEQRIKDEEDGIKFIEEEFEKESIRLDNLTELRNKNLVKEKEIQEEELNSTIALQDAKFAAASAGLNLLGALVGENEKIANALFIVDKALAIAKIIVDTQKEIAGYAANPTWSALPDGGAIIKGKYIIGAKIRAAASIGTIAATTIAKFKGGASASNFGGGGAINTSGTPIVPTQQTQLTQLNQNSINAIGNSAIRAYVVETDVTSNQKRVQAIKQRARFS
jgi:hypothetical protein